MILTSKFGQLGSWYVGGEISAKLDWSYAIARAVNHKRRHPNGRQYVPYVGIRAHRDYFAHPARAHGASLEPSPRLAKFFVACFARGEHLSSDTRAPLCLAASQETLKLLLSRSRRIIRRHHKPSGRVTQNKSSGAFRPSSGEQQTHWPALGDSKQKG